LAFSQLSRLTLHWALLSPVSAVLFQLSFHVRVFHKGALSYPSGTELGPFPVLSSSDICILTNHGGLVLFINIVDVDKWPFEHDHVPEGRRRIAIGNGSKFVVPQNL
jgi:hypothetical protein